MEYFLLVSMLFADDRIPQEKPKITDQLSVLEGEIFLSSLNPKKLKKILDSNLKCNHVDSNNI